MRTPIPHVAERLQSVACRYRKLLTAHGQSRGGLQSMARRPGNRPPRPSDQLAESEKNIRDHRLQRLEAILFLSREPLTTRKLSQYANLADGTEARTLVRRLNDLYSLRGRAFRVERVAGGYQMLSRPEFSNWVRRLDHVPGETRLSAPALETLAVVAYRQPVLRADIEAIRGVSCGEILRQLLERDLVRIGGRSDELGRPYLYTTTKHFLRTFGLQTIDSLPQIDTMAPLLSCGSQETELGGEPSSPAEQEVELSKADGKEAEMALLTLDDPELHEDAALISAPQPETRDAIPSVKARSDDDDSEDDDDYYDDDDDDDDDVEDDDFEDDDDDDDDFEDDDDDDVDEADDDDDDDEEEEEDDVEPDDESELEEDDWEEVEDDEWSEDDEDDESGWDYDDDDEEEEDWE